MIEREHHNGIENHNHQNNVKQLQIIRPIYDQEKLNIEVEYFKRRSKGLKKILPRPPNNTSDCCARFKNCLLTFFPILSWLPSYSIKNDLLADFITGCTVAIMHIPQGMGYALLANIPPIIGIYTAFFPVILYAIFGTSRHISMGTFAVVCIMVGKIVHKHSSNDITQHQLNLTDANVLLDSNNNSVSPVQIASAVCLIVGLVQLLMSIFRLGLITSLLSDSLISGFTTGAAIQVFVSQLKAILGISFKNEGDYFEVIYTVINICKNIQYVNWVSLALSAATMTCLIINNELLKPLVSKRCQFPVPMELILVLSGTLVSKYSNLTEYSVKTLEKIPTGLPDFNVPKTDLLGKVVIESIPIALVAYTVSISMALIFAQKLKYEVNSNQELFAMGVSNIFGSFFSCLPFAASLSRSIIQLAVGGKTQIASWISCCWLIIILLLVGPFFEPLPTCVLAGIIVVSLKGMIWQIKELPKFWKSNHFDAFVWAATFSTVILISIDIGLLVGVVLSILCIFFKSLQPYVCILGNVPGTELYVDIKRFKAAREISNTKVFRYYGSINFATRNIFKNKLCSLLNINLTKEIKNYSEAISSNQQYNGIEFEHLILDFSAVTYIDPSGAEALKTMIKEFALLDVIVYITGASCPVYEVMIKCGLQLLDKNLKFFPTLYDAVHHQEKSISLSISTIDTLV